MLPMNFQSMMANAATFFKGTEKIADADRKEKREKLTRKIVQNKYQEKKQESIEEAMNFFWA